MTDLQRTIIMCDCFHLAFPNWHASATGEGRRLRGPEQETDDDLICEEPEVLQGERPRPQGSSPVDEFPAIEKYSKQAESDFYESPTKTSKKGKRTAFGSMFDKRTTPKINQTEEIFTDQSETIVKTVKDVCAEGLVVSGGGKDGIFIKEVQPESPASKIVKKGDQILSATVYFDNMSCEDAIQILEHAQAYKVAFCVKRKPPPRTQEASERRRPDVTIGEEADQPDDGLRLEVRGRRKSKKPHDRISWPKFPNFNKSRRAHFKRSHSTSEAEEQRILELSPQISDTESPFKSPLKSPDGKDKKKVHKMKLKMKTASGRTKSVEETENEEMVTADKMEDLENQTIMNITEDQVPVIHVIEHPIISNETEFSSQVQKECMPPDMESLHKVEQISLNTTVKDSDIIFSIEEGGQQTKEISDLMSFKGKENFEIETENQLKLSTTEMTTPDSSKLNFLQSPIQIEDDGDQIDKLTSSDLLEKDLKWDETDKKMPKMDVCLEIEKTDTEKDKKETKILEPESYGIRTRGPLADIATSRSHFANRLNVFDFVSSETYSFDIHAKQDMSLKDTETKKIPVVSQPTSHVLGLDRSGMNTEENTDTNVKVNPSTFGQGDSKAKDQKAPQNESLLKREKIEIAGMEDQLGLRAMLKSPRVNKPKIENILINISPAGEAQWKAEEFNIQDVKEAVSKFPEFKLPDRDITGVLVQREVTFLEVRSEKCCLTPKGSPSKLSGMSPEKNINLPEAIYEVTQNRLPVVSTDQVTERPTTEQLDLAQTIEGKTYHPQIKLGDHKSKISIQLEKEKFSTSSEEKFTLPNREDIEIPGMEDIEKSSQQQKVLDPEAKYTDKYTKFDKKVPERKSKKTKISLPSFGILAPDIQFPGIAIDLPIKGYSFKSYSDTNKEIPTDKISIDKDHVGIKQTFEDPAFKKGDPGECKVEKTEHFLSEKIRGPILQEKENVVEEVKHVPIKDVATSPHKMKLPKLKMLKIKTNEAVGQDIVVSEPKLDSEKTTFKSDPKSSSLEIGKNWGGLKMPSLDVSVPKINISKTEAKLKQEETQSSAEFDKDAMRGAEEQNILTDHVSKVDVKAGTVQDFRDVSALLKIRIPLPKIEKVSQKKEQTINIDQKTDVEMSEPAQAEIKKAESKMKKRKISFPMFGCSKSDSRVLSDDTTLPAQQDINEPEIYVSSKITQQESEFWDSTDSPTKFRLPTTKLFNFGVSHSKTTNVCPEIQMSGIKGQKTADDVKLTSEPKASSEKKDLSLSQAKPEDNLSLVEEKVEIKDNGAPKVNGLNMNEIKSIEEIKLLKSENEGNLSGFVTNIPAANLSETDFTSASVDTCPQVTLFLPEVSVEVKEPAVNFTKNETKDTKLEIGTLGDNRVDIPNVAEKNMNLKEDLIQFKDSLVTNEGMCVGLNIEAEEPSLKEPTVRMSLPIDICLGEIESKKVANIMQKESIKLSKDEKSDSTQVVTAPCSPTKFKFPSISFPAISISFPKSTDNQMTKDHREEHTLEKKELTGELPSDPELNAPQINLGVNKREDVLSTPMGVFIDVQNDIHPSDIVFSTPEVKISPGEHGLNQKAAIIKLEKQPKPIEMEAHLPSLKVDTIILKNTQEIKLKEQKISFSKSPFAKTDSDDTSLHGKSVEETEMKNTEVTVPCPELKGKSTSGSLSKFKLPVISLPRFDFGLSKPKAESEANVDDVQSEMKASSVVESQVAREQDKERSKTSFEACPEISELTAKEVDPGNQGVRRTGFKFEFSFPKLTGPEFNQRSSKLDVERTEDTIKPAIENEKKTSGVKPETSLKKELPSASMITTNLDADLESEIKAQTKGILRDHSTKGGSPIKCKLPSFKLPKFGSSSSQIKPETIHLKGEEIVETRDLVGYEFTTDNNQILKTPSISLHQQKLENEDECTQIMSEFRLPQLDVDISEKSVKIPKEIKLDTELKESSVKNKKSGIASPEFGFSKPHIKALAIDIIGELDSSKLDGDVKTKEERMNLNFFNGESEQQDQVLEVKTKCNIPSVSLPKIRGQSGTEEKSMSAVDVSIQKPIECDHEIHVPLVDVKVLDEVTKGACVDCKVEEEEQREEGGNLKMPVVIGLPRTKGFDFSANIVPETSLKPEIKCDKNVLENSSNNLDVEPDPDQKEYTFGSPFKFKLPSTSLPKCVKSQKDAIDAEEKYSELKGTLSKPDVKVLGQLTSDKVKVEASADLPEVDSKRIEVKVKRPSFSFPKFGFSKPESEIPEVNVSLQNVEPIQSEGNVPAPEIIHPGKKPEKNDPLIKFKLPDVNLPTFEDKPLKVTSTVADVNINIDLNTLEADISKSEQIPKFERHSDGTVKDAETNFDECKDKRPLETDAQKTSLESKSGTVETDVKLKKPSFSFPKFGFSKTDKVHDVYSKKSKSDMSMQGPNISHKDQKAELTFTDQGNTQAETTHLTKFKLPSINLPKFGLKLPKTTAVLSKTVDAATEAETNIEINVPSVDVDIKPKETTTTEESGMTSKAPKIALNIKTGCDNMNIGTEQICIDQAHVKHSDVTLQNPNINEKLDKTQIDLGVDVKRPEVKVECPSIEMSLNVENKEQQEYNIPKCEIALITPKVPGSEKVINETFNEMEANMSADLKLREVHMQTEDISLEKSSLKNSDFAVKGQSISSFLKTDGFQSGTIKDLGFENNHEIEKQRELVMQDANGMNLQDSEMVVDIPQPKDTREQIQSEINRTSEIFGPNFGSPTKFKLPAIKLPKFGVSNIDNKECDSGSPSKFKLAAFKMPKFAISAQKTVGTKGKVDVPENIFLSTEEKDQASKDEFKDFQINEAPEKPQEPTSRKMTDDKDSPSRFKLPTVNIPKIGISRAKSHEEDDTAIRGSALEVKTEPQCHSQEPEQNPTFTKPALDDVLKGFEVELNVTTTEDIKAKMDKPSIGKPDQEEAEQKVTEEKSKFKFKLPKLGFTQTLDESDKTVEAKVEESKTPLESSEVVKEAKSSVNKEPAKTEKGSWFKFSFSPTKRVKTDEKVDVPPQPVKCENSDDVEKECSVAQEEPEKSSLIEAVEVIISPTLSLRSSEAFGDISSTVTTEQVFANTSPAKVKVKYADDTTAILISDMQSDVVTSRARCELISMEPHQPEKVNIPFSLDISSSSLETQKQISGEIHVINAKINTVPDTQQAEILEKIDSSSIHTTPGEPGADSVLLVEETRMQSVKYTMAESHAVTETLQDDKETIVVTQITHMFEGESAEPISTETASSIRRLRESVHTEKMKFFESVATVEETKSSETILRHIDSSTDENGGK